MNTKTFEKEIGQVTFGVTFQWFFGIGLGPDVSKSGFGLNVVLPFVNLWFIYLKKEGA